MLHVRIQRFSGMGTHFHVTLKADPVVGDVSGERVMKFRKRDTAVRWVNDVFEREYAAEHYELVWDDPEQHPWFYGEGD
jgi:hypothetical protein